MHCGLAQDGVVDFTEFVAAFADIPNFAEKMASGAAAEPAAE